MVNLYPFKFNPIFKEKLWGGKNLETLLGKALPANQKIGESWEICDRGLDQSIVANGAHQGKTLHELMNLLKGELLGGAYSKAPERFPLLFKIIDAQEDLSLQVHPDDAYAALHEKGDPGKTEMWYVLHCENGARIYCGFQKEIARTKLKNILQSHGELDFLKVYHPKVGDVFYIPAGTIHALGKGNVVIEIQENSDITYRLSDWGRLDPVGKARPLHIEKGLEVIHGKSNSGEYKKSKQDGRNSLLVECPYFTVREETYNSSFYKEISPLSFQVWTILEGSGTINDETFKKGDFFLIPAYIGKVSLAISAPLHILKTTQPCEKGA